MKTPTWQLSTEIEVQVVLVGLSRKRVLIGHNKLAQTLYEWSEHLGGDETIAQ